MDKLNLMEQKQDNVIDFFELFKTLWDGKWLISACAALTMLTGFGYSQFTQPKYNVSAPFKIEAYASGFNFECGEDISCKRSNAIRHLLAELDGGWVKTKRKWEINLSTSSPLSVSAYASQLETVNAALTNKAYQEAIGDLNVLKTELVDTLLSTETVARAALGANRVVRFVNQGGSIYTFGSVSVVKTSIKVELILALSVALGGIVGVVFTLARHAIKKSKDRLAKA